MKTPEYYRRLLEAINAARDWAGSMEPAQGDAYRQELDEPKKEVRRRRKQGKKPTRKTLYLQHCATLGVMTGTVFKIGSRWWFKCDGLGIDAERLVLLRREGWQPFNP